MALVITLPLEILRHIVTYLSFKDIGSFARCHYGLSSKLFGSSAYCKDLVLKHIPQSEEALLASSKKISFRKAITCSLQKQTSFAQGSPFHVTALPSGQDFFYGRGVLCILLESTVTIYHPRAKICKRLNLTDALLLRSSALELRYKLLGFAANVLSLRVDTENASAVVSLKLNEQGEFARSQSQITSISTSDRLVEVRNDEQYIVVATYRRTAEGSSWQFHVSSLDQKSTYSSSKRLNVGEFTSSDIGIDLVIEIFEHDLWVVSSGVTKDPEGKDPMSYYGGCRCRLSEPQREPEFWRIWRRNHTEGPIDESWTKLRLLKDDTGNFVITESRSEWLKDDEKSRSFYSTVFGPEDFKEASVTQGNATAVQSLAVDAATDEFDAIEEILAGVPDDKLTVFSGQRYRHAEFGNDSLGNSTKDPTSTYRTHETIASFFNHSADAFTDLVIRGKHSNDFDARFRFGSRTARVAHFQSEQSIENDLEKTLHMPDSTYTYNYTNNNNAKEYFTHQPIILFPQKTEPAIPRFKVRGIHETRFYADDNAIVFGPDSENGPKAVTESDAHIVLLSFDPLAAWGELEVLHSDADLGSEAREQHAASAEQRSSATESKAGTESSDLLTLLTTERNQSLDPNADNDRDSVTAMDPQSDDDELSLDPVQDEMWQAVAADKFQYSASEETKPESDDERRAVKEKRPSKRRRSPSEIRDDDEDEWYKEITQEGGETSASGTTEANKRRKGTGHERHKKASEDENGYTSDLLLKTLSLQPP